ncbi:hypothetical protein [Pantoea sp.]|uniref:hypothetical protein n=1 Tax=Pantoea sp. TaxID=69393 RepID=UPI0028A59FCB|nr:hypothetical protein [Pantoea sp.]
MTQVTHGLTRDELVKRVYGEKPEAKPKKRKRNATDNMILWIECFNQKRGE